MEHLPTRDSLTLSTLKIHRLHAKKNFQNNKLNGLSCGHLSINCLEKRDPSHKCHHIAFIIDMGQAVSFVLSSFLFSGISFLNPYILHARAYLPCWFCTLAMLFWGLITMTWFMCSCSCLLVPPICHTESSFLHTSFKLCPVGICKSHQIPVFCDVLPHRLRNHQAWKLGGTICFGLLCVCVLSHLGTIIYWMPWHGKIFLLAFMLFFSCRFLLAFHFWTDSIRQNLDLFLHNYPSTRRSDWVDQNIYAISEKSSHPLQSWRIYTVIIIHNHS